MVALEHHQLNHSHNHSNNNNIKEAGLGFLPRSCDACRSAAALLFCRSHAAFFCGACDCAATGNRHERVWMCEVCEQAPAVVTCKADAAALCSACDADVHSANPLAHRHERVPVIPFVDSVSEAAARSSAAATAAFVDPRVAKEDDDAEAWLIQNPSSRVLMADFLCCDSDLLDFRFSSQNNLEKVTLNGNFENNNRSSTFGGSVVPSQSKGNLSFPADVNRAFENCFDIDFSQPQKHHKLNSNEQLFSSFKNYFAQHSASSSEVEVVPDGNATSMSEVSYTFTKSITTTADAVDGVSSAGKGAPATTADRKARVLRYRERRKNRKFEKTIRYASRKAYAETRPRIQGRFAKRTETNEASEMEPIYGIGSGSTGFLIDHGGYGVVPSL